LVLRDLRLRDGHRVVAIINGIKGINPVALSRINKSLHIGNIIRDINAFYNAKLPIRDLTISDGSMKRRPCALIEMLVPTKCECLFCLSDIRLVFNEIVNAVNESRMAPKFIILLCGIKRSFPLTVRS